MQAGRAASLAPDFKKAKVQAAKIFDVIDREPEIDNLSDAGTKPEVRSSKWSYFCPQTDISTTHFCELRPTTD